MDKEAPWTLLRMVFWVNSFHAPWRITILKIYVVIGVGKGTKKLSEFLDCVKVIKVLPGHSPDRMINDNS